jgi:hypothetical protein
MKFKTLLSKIQSLQENAPEATFGGGLYIGTGLPTATSALTNKGTHNIKLPKSLDAINALLQAFSSKDYIDPDEVTSIMKMKLNHFGFDFEKKGVLQDGENTFQLYQYGSPYIGVYGQNPYDDVNEKGFNQGDGISEKLGHSLNLVINIQRGPNMLRRVNAMIVPSATNNMDGVNAVEESDCGCSKMQ